MGNAILKKQPKLEPSKQHRLPRKALTLRQSCTESQRLRLGLPVAGLRKRGG